MTDPEWATVAEVLDSGFKGDFDAAKERVYRRRLDGFPPGEVVAALDRLMDRGQVFLPAVAEVLVALRAGVPFGEIETAVARYARLTHERRVAEQRLAGRARPAGELTA